jgi:hypothetical protein
MSFKAKILLITFVFAIPAFFLGRIIWVPSPMMGEPTAAMVPFFIILSIFESLSFGLGMAFLFLGWPMVQKVSGKSDILTELAFLSIAWYLINWWPHDNLHASIGMDLQKLLYIEYGFHVTMIIAGVILAYFFLTRIIKIKLG